MALLCGGMEFVDLVYSIFFLGTNFIQFFKCTWSLQSTTLSPHGQPIIIPKEIMLGLFFKLCTQWRMPSQFPTHSCLKWWVFFCFFVCGTNWKLSKTVENTTICISTLRFVQKSWWYVDFIDWCMINPHDLMLGYLSKYKFNNTSIPFD